MATALKETESGKQRARDVMENSQKNLYRRRINNSKARNDKYEIEINEIGINEIGT